MESSELNYRSELFKGLRVDLNCWTQKEFVSEFRNAHVGESMSQSMVSRLEHRARVQRNAAHYSTPLSQRRKEIDEDKALFIAETFGVDNGLFLPSIVSSVY